ncbi:Hypothetical protein LUCI_4685 [Lucifera butyrica]|uniref:protein-tyrosine-phosphatase n=1 Tax=Lucifera butyrica TaxID=1351585 RepID=A0A498REG6_9FIRM|nr:CpsB/CapC family capsule biosynthesis tyrosine phosphatase [Lucifera butyrica]VBB09395.1 Hypothetical protein LUCI_4685 [Lucifera butyrica]
MIDMHCHLLPQMDDGAKSLPVSLEMAKIAADNGTTAIIASPHMIAGEWTPEWEKILVHCKRLQEACRERQIDLAIYPGAEVAISMDVFDYLEPAWYCLNGGRYMLVELPFWEIPAFAEEFFFRLQTRGITPILAHPERYPDVIREPGRLIDWVNNGILLQINSSSLTGLMGEKVQRTAQVLLMSHLVHFLGSDAHGVGKRHPNLRQAAAIVEKISGKEQANRILVVNPAKVIANQAWILCERINKLNYPSQPGFWGRLLQICQF